MEVDDRFNIEWVQASGHIVGHHHDDDDDVVDGMHLASVDGNIVGGGVANDDDIIEEEFLVGEEIIPSSEINAIPNSLDQIAAENLIYMAQDGNVAIMGDLIEEQVEQAENADYNGEHQYFECQEVTEEVITDDWVQQQGEDRVEVPVDQIGGEACVGGANNDDDVDVPLPTDQDEYTTSRPYPCDFCSRRFRKKGNLMNHMVAHKNDRPHICNLCGARYIRRVDLLNHLKVHAQVPEQELEMGVQQHQQQQQQQHQHHHQQLHHHQQQQTGYVITEIADTMPLMSVVQHDHEHSQSLQHPVSAPTARGSASGSRKTAKSTTKSARAGGTAKQKRAAAAAAAAAAEAAAASSAAAMQHQHMTIVHQQQHDLYAPVTLTLDPPTMQLKKEYIHQEDMQLLIDAAQQHEHEHYANMLAAGSSTSTANVVSSVENTAVTFTTEPVLIENAAAVAAPLLVERYPVIDPVRPFVCQRCGVSFGREKALLSHSKMHVTDQPFECDSCSDTFWDVRELREHQRIHHAGQSSNSEYEPDERDAADDRSDDDDDEEVVAEDRRRRGGVLQQQQQVHEEEEEDDNDSEADSRYGQFYCSTCGMSFHRHELLLRHQKTHTSDAAGASNNDDGDVNTTTAASAAHSCTVCGESFAEALDLLAHAEVHARFQPFKCQLCGEQFVDEAVIKRHVTNVHAAELSDNTCRLCGKQCRDSRTLMKHSWEHSSEKNHSCSKCGKTFHNKARLKRHMQSHRNKSVRCDVCAEEFPDGRSLMNHRHSHTNVSGRQFPCKECGKTFGSRSSQQIHMRIHTGERPYGCRFCWKAFADGGTLRKHERIHTGEKPYACPVCPRAFNQRVVLREHIRSHHSRPDVKNGSAVSPFYCAVCGDSFGTSVLLIQHLIEHSDINTAMKRQPPTGPRKYKRRRKLKPHELEQRARNDKKNAASGSTAADADDFDIDYTDHPNGGGIDLQPPPARKPSTSIDDDVAAVAAATAAAFKRGGVGGGASTADDDDDADEDNDPFGRYASSSPSKRLRLTANTGGGSPSITATRREKKQSFSTTATAALDDHYSVFNNVEHTLQNIDSLVIASGSSSSNGQNHNNNNVLAHSQVATTAPAAAKTTAARKRGGATVKTEPSTSSSSSRPKMIHTQKTRVPVDEVATTAGSGTKRRTKTLITSRTKDAAVAAPQPSSTAARNARRRGATADDGHLMGAAFNIKQEDPLTGKPLLSETDILLKLSRSKSTKYSPDVVKDLEEILRSPSSHHRYSQSQEEPSHTAAQPSSVNRRPTRSTRATAAVRAAHDAQAAADAAAAAAEAVAALADAAMHSSPAHFMPFGGEAAMDDDDEGELSATTRLRLMSQTTAGTTTDAESGTDEMMDRRHQQQQQLALLQQKDVDDVHQQLHFQPQPHNHHIHDALEDDEEVEDVEQPDDEDDHDPMLLHDGSRLNIKQERDEPQYSLTEPDVMAEDEVHMCEMCAAVFGDREQLLLHVPIHI